MRVFIGIDLDDAIRGKIARFLEGVSPFAPEARWVRPESLHITLKFIGEQKEEQVMGIAERLRGVASEPIEIQVSSHGFFPTLKSARVFWIGIQAGQELAALAGQIDARVAELGIEREKRTFSPHLTLARAGGRPGDPKRRKSDRPNSVFEVLQRRVAAMGEIDFGTMTANKFILYQSQLSPTGSKYTKLERFPMSSAMKS